MIGNWNYGTGHRKSSVARVFMKKGTGQILVNGKTVDEYFGRQTNEAVPSDAQGVHQPSEPTMKTFSAKPAEVVH